jgi:zinc protease
MEAPEIPVEKFTLPNGLTLFVAEEHHSNVASVQVWCETGSVHEGDWVGGGLTHLLEHMLFKGTARRTANRINEEIHEVGGFLNAYTSFDRTVFWVDCPGNAVRTALDVTADMLFGSVIDAHEMEREMDVIRREFDLGYDDPDRTLSHLTFDSAFQVHPCRFPVIGLRRIFDKIDRESLLTYYRRRYVPDNVFVVVAGDVEAGQVKDWVGEFFGPAPSLPPGVVTLPDEPGQVGRREAVTQFDTALGYFSLAWHIPRVTHEDVPALDALAILLGGGASSFLYEEIREKMGLVHGIGAYAFTPGFPGLLTIAGTCGVDTISRIDHIVLEQLTAWRKGALTAGDLAKAKRIIWVSSVEQLQTVKGIASDIGLNWLYTRNLKFNRRYLRQVEAVSTEHVRSVFDRYVSDDNLTVTSLRPKSLAKPVAGRRSSRKPNQVRVLPNGVPVVLIPDDRLPILQGSVVIRAGVLAESAKNNGINRLYSQCLLKGTKDRSAREIAEIVESLGATLFGDSGYNSSRLAFGALSEDFGQILSLVTEILSSPSFPEEAIERERASQIAAIDADEGQPAVVARTHLRRAMYGDHPYAMTMLGTRATLTNIQRDDLARLHRWLLTKSAWAIGICGHFDEEKLWDLLSQTLGRLPIDSSGGTFKLPLVAPFQSKTIVEQHKRHQAFVTVGYLACSLADPERVAWEVLDEGAGDASSRFFVKVREEMGLAYSVGTSLALGLAPGLFSVYAATAPEMATEVAKLYHEEIGAMAAEGLSQHELERSKKKLLAQLGFQKQNLETFCHTLALNQLYGFDLEYFDRRQREIEQITLEQVQAVCRKYLMDKPSITVIVKA